MNTEELEDPQKKCDKCGLLPSMDIGDYAKLLGIWFLYILIAAVWGSALGA